MKIEVNGGDVSLHDVFSGICIETDQGLFGVCQRDGGIVVMLDGREVWSSSEVAPEEPCGCAWSRSAIYGDVLELCRQHQEGAPIPGSEPGDAGDLVEVLRDGGLDARLLHDGRKP